MQACKVALESLYLSPNFKLAPSVAHVGCTRNLKDEISSALSDSICWAVLVLVEAVLLSAYSSDVHDAGELAVACCISVIPIKGVELGYSGFCCCLVKYSAIHLHF